MVSLVQSTDLSFVLRRNLLFVHGKGGVGKTVVSQTIATALSRQNLKTLWITLEDPTCPMGELRLLSPSLWHLNCGFLPAFEEYLTLKIGGGPMSRFFLQNKLIRYLAKAAPGIHELILLGKIWFERLHYSHLVIDLPSTGYSLAMFQSTQNFSQLFQGGPLNQDAQAMLTTFKDPQTTGHLILALPEEMPLKEALELHGYLTPLFPDNPPAFLVNRVFPTEENHPKPILWTTPLATSMEDYIHKRIWLEDQNLKIWKDQNLKFGKLDFIPPQVKPNHSSGILEVLIQQLHDRAYL